MLLLGKIKHSKRRKQIQIQMTPVVMKQLVAPATVVAAKVTVKRQIRMTIAVVDTNFQNQITTKRNRLHLTMGIMITKTTIRKAKLEDI